LTAAVVAAEADELVAEPHPTRRGEARAQRGLGGARLLFADPAQAPNRATHMHVSGYRRHAEGIARHHRRGFPSETRQSGEMR
jgi:hypothetical protein